MNNVIKSPFIMRKVAVIALCAIWMFNLSGNVLYAQKDGNAAWDYPVKPGMEEWNNLKTEQERIDALQVPEEVLEKMSSEELVELCIKFPRFGYYGAFITPQHDGFSVMLIRFNIFEHLLTRKDAGKYLIATYKDAGMQGFESLPYSNEFWTIKLEYLELILAQRNIMLSLTSAEKLELITESRKKFSEKIVDEAFSSLPGILPSVRIMAGILDIEEFQELTLSSNR